VFILFLVSHNIYGHRITPPIRAAAKMPPLRHYPIEGGPFNISKSEVVAWLMKQPELQQELFNLAKRAGAIAFDPQSGCWCGVESKAAL
jgi:hypothetical protein